MIGRIQAATLALLGALAGPTLATVTPEPSDAEDRRPRDEIRRFADEFFAEQLVRFDIPGAVFVVADRDGALLESGYGVADRQTGRVVDPSTTRFRVGSVGKTFTALAILQLVERGTLRLSGNVNDVLAHSFDEAGHGPITLRQLLVHTAGYDERLIGYFADEDRRESLGDYLERRMPRRSFPPGDLSRYSNHGYALAGLVLEQATGQSFRLYADRHIFEPLGMARTEYLTLPLPEWTKELATEYWASGETAPLLVSNPYPAGSLATTGSDMVRFLAAFLAQTNQSVLSEELRDRMTTVQFAHHPELPGLTYGMNRTRVRGRDVVLKTGSGQCHAAIVGVLPDHGIGFFGAVNRQEPQIWMQLLPRLVGLFPVHDSSDETASIGSGPRIDPRTAAGEYRLARYAEGSIERLLSLATHATVTANGPDSVSIAMPAAAELGGEFERVSDSVFRADDGDRSIGFRATGSRVTHLFLDLLGEPFAFERIRSDESVNATLLIVGLAVAVLISLILASAVRGVMGVFRGKPRRRPDRGERWASLLITGSGSLSLITVVMLVLALAKWKHWARAAPTELVLAAASGTLLPLLALACFIATGFAWRRSYWGGLRRVHFTIGAVALALLAGLLVRFNVWLGGL